MLLSHMCCSLQGPFVQVEGVGQLPGWGIATCSAGSAAVAAWITHPVDVVKTRLQVCPPPHKCLSRRLPAVMSW